VFTEKSQDILHSFNTFKRNIWVDNIKLFITSYELSVFRNSEFSIQKINNCRSCWLGCVVVGALIRKPIRAWMLVHCVWFVLHM